MNTEPTPDVPSDTHCEYCGLAYEDAGVPEGATRRTPRAAAEAKATPPAAAKVPFLTHCEYCGTEFPEGSGDAPTADSGPQDTAEEA